MLVHIGLELVGDNYVTGGGHGPLSPPPTKFDCSGFIRYIWYRLTGRDDFNGTSESQWANRIGGVVSGQLPLLPGDFLYLRGDGTYPPPGHTGICISYDPSTKSGTYVSAYDTAEGVVVHTFIRWDNDWVGALRPASLVPDPRQKPQEHEMQFIAQGPGSTASFLYDTVAKTRHGLSQKDTVSNLQKVGIIDHKNSLDHDFLGLFALGPNWD